jgi:hypothetical protein
MVEKGWNFNVKEEAGWDIGNVWVDFSPNLVNEDY